MAVVAAGYIADWSWTGFRGNTFWDWLNLLLVPLLLPTLIVPALASRTARAMEAAERSKARLSDSNARFWDQQEIRAVSANPSPARDR